MIDLIADYGKILGFNVELDGTANTGQSAPATPAPAPAPAPAAPASGPSADAPPAAAPAAPAPAAPAKTGARAGKLAILPRPFLGLLGNLGVVPGRDAASDGAEKATAAEE